MLLGPVDFGQHVADLAGDRHECHTAATLGARGDELREPTIVRLRACQTERGIEVARQPEARAERYAGAALDGIRVGIDDLGRDTIRVQRLVALDRIPATGELIVVFVEPVLRELRIAHAHLGDLFEHRGAPGEEVLERRMELLFEVGAVLLGG